MQHVELAASAEKVAGLELIPGHATTTAEVWVWRGPLPDVHDGSRSCVVLRADDWPMSADRARELAAALLEAADRATRTWAPAGPSAGAGGT